MAGRKIRGKNCLFYLMDTDGGENPLAGHNGDLTLDMSADVVETTERGPGRFKNYDTTLIEYSVSAGGFYIPDDASWRKLRNAFLTGVPLPFMISLAGAETYRGEVIVTSFPINMALTEFVQVAMDLQGTGELEYAEGTSPAAADLGPNAELSEALKEIAGRKKTERGAVDEAH